MDINDLQNQFEQARREWAEWGTWETETGRCVANACVSADDFVGEIDYTLSLGYTLDDLATPMVKLYIAGRQLLIAKSCGIDAAILWKLSQGGTA